MRNVNAISIPVAGQRLRIDHFVSSLAGWLYACAERRRQRLALLELNDSLLRDIGVTRAEAVAEASKPCWRER